MSYAVMPLIDYKAACDKVREKVDLTTVKFEETDFGYLRSEIFTVPKDGIYIFSCEFSSPINLAYLYYANPQWQGDSSPGIFEPIDSNSAKTTGNLYTTRQYRLFIDGRSGLTTKDILKASLSIDGETVVDFITTPTIKSGELADKVDKVYEAGRKDEQTEFWEEFQMGGKRTYYYRFGTGTTQEQFWTDKTYNPIYPLTIENGQELFGQNVALTDTKVPIVLVGTQMNYAFGGATKLKTIRSLDITNVTSYTSTFYACYALENINFVGTVKVDLSFVHSKKLTHESLMSIINALYDFSSDTNGTAHTLKLGTENLAKLTQAEKDRITNKGWQYS